MSRCKVLARGVEYYPDRDELLLLRCPKCGRENYALNVAKGICTWCGFNAREMLKQRCVDCKHYWAEECVALYTEKGIKLRPDRPEEIQEERCRLYERRESDGK